MLCEPLLQQTMYTSNGKSEDKIQNVVDIDINTSAVRRVAHCKLHLQHLQNRNNLDEAVQIDEIVMKSVNILEKRQIHLLGHVESTDSYTAIASYCNRFIAFTNSPYSIFPE